MKKTLSLLLVFSVLLSGCGLFQTTSPAEVEVAEPPADEAMDVQSAAPETADEGLASIQSAGTATMYLEPANQTVNVGQTFNMTVQVGAGAQQVNTVQVSLKFDPTYLEVVSLTQVGGLDGVIQNTFDNAAGTVSYAAAKLGASVTGNFNVVQIAFKARASIASTTVAFQSAQPLPSDVLMDGSSVMASTTNGNVVIQTGGVVPTSTPVPGFPTATPGVPPGGTTYVVQPGDNLYRIGLKFGIPWTTIKSYNNLPSTLIYVGQVLNIPGSGSVVPTAGPYPTLIPGNTTHTVLAGQNLFRIGLMYGVQWPAIMAHNGLTTTLIYPGQVLRIP
ncbi:MAG: LysM peptidoglycan-binding domain-containing protein [Anaerolineaceae bacterium]|jgi:LysM repeat protein|nr:LysM peptidoglycan-binding domain-containing protein [Anaerolineaceae bacterium]